MRTQTSKHDRASLLIPRDLEITPPTSTAYNPLKPVFMQRKLHFYHRHPRTKNLPLFVEKCDCFRSPMVSNSTKLMHPPPQGGSRHKRRDTEADAQPLRLRTYATEGILGSTTYKMGGEVFAQTKLIATPVAETPETKMAGNRSHDLADMYTWN